MKHSLVLAAVSALAVHAAPTPNTNTKRDLSQSLQAILSNTHNSDAYQYPTDLTRGIMPKKIHSHNDYWRDIPFYTALSNGCISIEADVWLINNTLYVGHEPSALTSTRTLSSLYIEPILSVLKRENPLTAFTPSPTRNGVFDTTSTQTLYLFIDVKTDGPTTWPAVLNALTPLRSAGYLTNYTYTSNKGSIQSGPVTIIGTGNTPISSVSDPTKMRDYFYDAPLTSLNDTQYSNLTSLESPIASTDFLVAIGTPANGTEGFSDRQLQTIRSQIATASSRGIGARYWDTPAWPITIRDVVWKTLEDEGVALLNADALGDAAGF